MIFNYFPKEAPSQMFDGVFSLPQLEAALENSLSRNFRTHGRKQTEWFRMKKKFKTDNH